VFGWSCLDDRAQVHDNYSLSDMVDHRKIVGDQQHAHVQVTGECCEQIGHLRLD